MNTIGNENVWIIKKGENMRIKKNDAKRTLLPKMKNETN